MSDHDPSAADRNPTGAAAATVISLVGLVVLGAVKLGAATLLLVPIFAIWVVTVYLGAPLGGPIEFRRLRQLRR